MIQDKNCGNCRFYDPLEMAEQFGFCTNHPKQSDKPVKSLRGRHPVPSMSWGTGLGDVGLGFEMLVTDCALCSKWESAQPVAGEVS